MKYISTRNINNKVSASEAIIKGMASDGGLFVPETFPQIDKEFLISLQHCSYQERAKKILALYLSDYSAEEISTCVDNAYGHNKFDTAAIAPIVSFNDEHCLELWHGPTSAFKDMALQLLPQLMSTALKKTKAENDIVILVATSGDTGKAALEGFCDVDNIKIIVFYPQEGVSDIQRRQMITQKGRNVEVIAIEGNFDDAQSGVKRIFNDNAINELLTSKGYNLSSANSINWGRLLPQIVYYFSAYCDLVNTNDIEMGQKINFTVPTGNFGDILAGFYAKEMGLPVNKLICASNSNNVLTDFFATGTYDKKREFFKTISPSMDILISSNLERLLFHMVNDDKQLNTWMNDLQTKGTYTVNKEILEKITAVFAAQWLNEEDTLTTIKDVYDKYNYVIDPHTAVAWHAAQAYKNLQNDDSCMVVLSTASPYKFNDNVLKALNIEVSGKDEFTLLAELKKYNKQNIPAGLTALNGAATIHSGICQPEKMAQAIKKYLKI
ncbi:threonine synthase [Pectinatus brassicae]|uniref:Threonine synthase n=1 Tax=Pectinatus brassicae TaxID=862415 RepID=A0A840UK34_9FIRM|nr:threonine synthase [Pectinatus brassicae]MBB5336007.1 threonine synthase [Pectinatus brassicae]